MGIQGKYYQRFPSLSFFISLISKYFQVLGKVFFTFWVYLIFLALDVKLVLLIIIDDLYWFIKVRTGVQPSRLEMAICK